MPMRGIGAGARIVVATVGFAVLGGCAIDGDVQTIDKPPAGILVEDGAKPLLPAGVEIRPVHPKGLELTKVAEGWVPRLYNDAAGYCTVGYGHLIKKAKCDGSEPSEFLKGISMVRGSELLTTDMAAAQIAIMTMVTVVLNDTQYSALTDFVFNIGATNFRNSTLLKRTNANQFDQVPAQLRRWTLADGKTYKGLVTRREGEIVLFFDGQPVPKPLPSPDEDMSPIDISTGEPVEP
jgi:GH24 family phage-related lysozyme (muramidase)